MSIPAIPRRTACLRSRVSNGSDILIGVDGRSAMARRYRDLVEGLADQIGGSLGESERLQIRNAATLQLHAEDLTSRLVRGEQVDAEELTRAANGATRALSALRKKKPAKRPAGGGLADFLARKEQTA